MWYISNCVILTVQYSVVIYNLLVRYETVPDFGSVVSSFSFPLPCVCNLNSILLLAPFLFHLKNIFTIYHAFHSFIHSLIQSFQWHVQSVTIPCHSQELLQFLSATYFLLPPFSASYSSILSHFILPSISWYTSQSYCSQIHI